MDDETLMFQSRPRPRLHRLAHVLSRPQGPARPLRKSYPLFLDENGEETDGDEEAVYAGFEAMGDDGVGTMIVDIDFEGVTIH